MTTRLRPRVLLADDCADLLTSLERLLSTSCDVVGQVTDAGRLIDEARRLEPDVIVLDLFMRPGNGLEACRQLKTAVPKTKTIIVSASNHADITSEALHAGAAAFVGKIRAAYDLLPAIQDALGTSA